MTQPGPTHGNPFATALSYALAGGFYVTLWAAILALTAGAVWFGGQGPVAYRGVPSWALSGWCLFTAIFVVLAQFLSRRRRGGGRALTRQEAPELFGLLDELRRQLGAPVVREVRLNPGPVLGSTRLWRRKAATVRQHSAIVIGLPLLRTYSVEELRGALAHELAHFVGGDVRRRRFVNSAWTRIALMRAVLERGGMFLKWFLTWLNPLWWYLCGYGLLLRAGVSFIRRSQECHADDAGARVAGRDVYARALVKGAALGVAFRRLAPGVLLRSLQGGGAPTENVEEPNFFVAVADAIAAMAPRDRRRLVREVLDTEARATDEHPSLRHRLAAIGVTRPPRGSPPGRSAAELVPDLDRIEREMTPWAVRGIALGLRSRLERRMRLRGTASA